MAASARWKTQGRGLGARDARSRGMENVALNEITTASCEPCENGDVKRFGMTPNAARKTENYGKVDWNLYGDLNVERSDKPAFKIGDTVRISKYKRKT